MVVASDRKILSGAVVDRAPGCLLFSFFGDLSYIQVGSFLRSSLHGTPDSLGFAILVVHSLFFLKDARFSGSTLGVHCRPGIAMAT